MNSLLRNADKKTRKIVFSLIKRKHTYSILKKIDEINVNRLSAIFSIPAKTKDFDVSLDGIQCIEIYNRHNKKQVKNIFNHYAKMALKYNENPYSHIKHDAEHCINSLLNDNYSYQSAFLQDFIFKPKSHYIQEITISMNAVGPSLYRINYNMKLTKEVKNQYQELLTQRNSDAVEIRQKKFNRYKLDFKILYGQPRKEQKIKDLEERIINNAKDFIEKNARGLILESYNTLPCMLRFSYCSEKKIVSNYDDIYTPKSMNLSYLKGLFNPTKKKNNFFYYDKEYNHFFIPTDITHVNDIEMTSRLFMNTHSAKHFSFINFHWCNTMRTFYKIQFLALEEINHLHIFNQMKINKEDKKKLFYLQKIDANLAFINSSYEVEKEYFQTSENKYTNQVVFYDSYGRVEFYENEKGFIDFCIEKSEDIIPSLKESYEKLKDDRNHIQNRNIQYLIIFLTIITFFQTITQCGTKESVKNYLPTYNINKTYNDDQE